MSRGNIILMNEKYVGYFLLSIGVLAIVLSAAFVILVFSGSMEPVEIFKFEGIGINADALLGENMPAMNSEVELISSDIINETSNLFAHLFLMGFISTAGYKVASIGAMLIRPVVVKLKEVKDDTKTAA